MDPPIFDRSDAQGWVTRIQYFFDHIMLPAEQRLHYVVMLFSPPASDWVFSYRASNPYASWTKFLDDVRKRFDPNYYVNYIELLTKLTQTGAIGDYNREFEHLLNQVQGVAESILIPIYLGGLRQPLRSQVRLQHPSSIASAMALATELESATDRVGLGARKPWQGRSASFQQLPAPTSVESAKTTSGIPSSGRNRDLSRLPIVRLSATEKRERTSKGLCWYCPDKWRVGHVCKTPVLAYMGAEEDIVEDDQLVDDGDEAPGVVTADLSHMCSMDGRPRASSMGLHGLLSNREVFILVDSGSTHNFVHPKIAERCCIELMPITPFRVYMGNGQSLICTHVSSMAEIVI